MSDIDTTATQQLGELLDDLDAVGIDVSWARVRQPVLDMLERSGLLDRIGEDHVFLEVDDAVTHYLEPMSLSSDQNTDRQMVDDTERWLQRRGVSRRRAARRVATRAVRSSDPRRS